MKLQLIGITVAASVMGLLVNTSKVLSQPSQNAATKNIVLQWNELALQAIRETKQPPTLVARQLAILNTSMFDAWAAYDPRAVSTMKKSRVQRPRNENNVKNKNTALSYAAYRVLVDLLPAKASLFNEKMASLGYEVNTTSTRITNPAGVGNLAAKVLLEYRHQDGSNQLGNLSPGAYSDYTGYQPVNDPDHIYNPNRWQPLRVSDGKGGFVIQKSLTPQWGKVIPFAVKPASLIHNIPKPKQYSQQGFVEQAEQLINYSANLGDVEKSMAEYWADGPYSETPPGHWNLFAQYVSWRDKHNLDQDVKLFFTLSNANLDASIFVWDCKTHYDYVRPITAIRHLFYGKKITAWAGPYQGTKVIDGSDWLPYQVLTFVTPPFAEYVSGHSTFSAASAEILKRFTGSDALGASYIVKAGSSLVEPGAAPSQDVTLSWATFTDAANQAALSRRYGGIHFEDGDLAGRSTGRTIAAQVWQKAQKYINGR